MSWDGKQGAKNNPMRSDEKHKIRGEQIIG